MGSAIFYTHQTSDACAGVCACNRKHQMEKTARKVHIFNFFKKSWSPLFIPPLHFWKFCLHPFLLILPPKYKKVFSPSETVKLLLLGCKYGDTIAKRNRHYSIKICKDVFVTNNIQRKNKDLAKMIIFLYILNI